MRGLISAVVVAVAIVLQLTVADRISFPGGTGPNLVLLTVAALALATGPMAGSLTGFSGGLALDVAPPAGHLVGEDALVFCLIGYLCGLLATRPSAEGLTEPEHSALFEIGVTAAGVACGEVMAAGLGVMLSDPRVTWPAIKHVLPVAIAYDLLLSPFVLFAVAAMLGVAGAVVHRGTPSAAGPARRAAWAQAPQAGSLRQVNGGATPRLRLSGTGGRSEAWRGAGATSVGTGRSALTGGREPRLKLGRGSPAGGSAFAGTGTGIGTRNGHTGTTKVKFAARRGAGVVGGSGLGSPRLGAGPRLSAGGAGSRLSASKLGSSRLGASLLGGSVFSRPAPRFGRPSSITSQSRPLPGRSPFLPGRSLLPARSAFRIGRTGGALTSARSPGGTRAGSLGSGSHQPRFRRANAMTRLVRGLRRPDRRKSPGRGWLRGPATSRTWLRAGRAGRAGRAPLGTRRGPRLRSPGSGWLGRPRGRKSLSGRKPLSGRSPARLRLRPAKLKRRPGGLR